VAQPTQRFADGSCNMKEKGHRANPQQVRWIDAVAHSFNDQACLSKTLTYRLIIITANY